MAYLHAFTYNLPLLPSRDLDVSVAASCKWPPLINEWATAHTLSAMASFKLLFFRKQSKWMSDAFEESNSLQPGKTGHCVTWQKFIIFLHRTLWDYKTVVRGVESTPKSSIDFSESIAALRKFIGMLFLFQPARLNINCSCPANDYQRIRP